MSPARLYIIPTDFWRLDPPLSEREKMQLRKRSHVWQNEEIHVWDERLLVEQDKMQICVEEQIPTKIIHHEFEARRDAAIWAIQYTLERRAMSEFWRYYLLGQLYYEMQKREEEANLMGTTGLMAPPRVLLSAQFDLTSSTLSNYDIYARGIRRFWDAQESVAYKILQGDIRVSLNNMRYLSRIEEEKFQQVVKRFQETEDLDDVFQVTAILAELIPAVRRKREKVATIKDMPQFDPDAEMTSLMLTLPIWTRQMERTRDSSDFQKISKETATAMEEALVRHRVEIQHFLRLLRKANYGYE